MQFKSITLLRERNMEKSSNQYVLPKVSCCREIWPNLLLCPDRISNSFQPLRGDQKKASATLTQHQVRFNFSLAMGIGYYSAFFPSTAELPSNFKFIRMCYITPFIPIYYSFRRTKCISYEGGG